jgi:hypothetical protein
MGIGTRLVPSGGLGDLMVGWLLVALVALAMRHRAAPTVVALLSTSECMGVHGLRGRDRGKVIEPDCNCGRVDGNFGAQSRVALRSVVLCGLEQRREVAVAVEEVGRILSGRSGRRRSRNAARNAGATVVVWGCLVAQGRARNLG